MSAFYITTAIEYANGEPHLGHAFEKIGADAIARYRRLRGDTVHVLVGSDDHGLKVARAAQAAGRTPGEQANQISAAFRRAWDALGIGYDRFVRTSTAEHAAGVRALIGRILARHPDAFYEKAYVGWYCVGCESFRTPRELDNGRCAVHPSLDIERVAESNWFFRLSAFREQLATFLSATPEFVQPVARYNEVLSLVERGLEDVSITRASLDWGIPFPIADARGRHQTIYVWFDALPSYLTATGFPEAHDGAEWPAQVHVVGKDITRFHCVLWPAVLIAAGLPLPERVWAHGFVTANGVRLSKSAGAWIDLDEAIARYGVDALRYFLLREIPFGNDGDFSHRSMVQRINSDLANGLGNLAQRVLSMINKNCAEQVPQPGAFTEADKKLLGSAHGLLAKLRPLFAEQAFNRALEAIWQVVGEGDRYVDENAPWALKKTDPARMATVLYVLAETVRNIAILVQPIMPDAIAKMLDQLAVPGDARTFAALGETGALKPGTALPKPEGVFPRYVEEAAQ